MKIDREETGQLKELIQNLLEDCEQVRKAARRELMQEVVSRKGFDERTNQEFGQMLDHLSVGQMKMLKEILCPQQILEDAQFSQAEPASEQHDEMSDRQLMS